MSQEQQLADRLLDAVSKEFGRFSMELMTHDVASSFQAKLGEIRQEQ